MTIIFGPDFNTLIERLSALFDLLLAKGLKVNLSKCSFAQTEVKFLGHIVSKEGCRPDPANTEAIQKMKPPTSVKEVRRFLELCGFYRKHVPSFAQIAAPLTNLTKNTVEFVWTDVKKLSRN